MMDRCGHIELKLSCPICTSREDLIEKIAELRAVIKRLADCKPLSSEGEYFDALFELETRIVYAEQHATEEG